MGEYQRVCRLDELADGEPHHAVVDEEGVVLVRQGGEVFALRDNCSHQDMLLSDGQVLEGRIKCRAHGAEFCLRTGKALCAPAFAPVAAYPVKVEDGVVWVDVE